MIYTQMNGRCGNQLFRYAFSKKLQQIYEEEIYFDYHSIEERKMLDATFFDNLSEFDITYKKICENQLILKYGSVRQIICYSLYKIWEKIVASRMPKVKMFRYQNKLQKVMNYFGIYNLKQGDCPIGRSKEKNKFVLGNCENKKYFDDIKYILQKEIKPRKIAEKNQELVKKISSMESVCISIRRGDYLSEKHKSRNICTGEYFQKAIAQMKLLKPNCTFFVFSDDIEGVRNNFDFGDNVYFETGDDTIAEKLYLMSACKNFIISNSTFSWWAQYLSTNEDKIVISPKQWFKYEGFVHPLIDEDWILVEC